MDKRSLLFLVCVSVAFYGINMFFGTTRSEPKAPPAVAVVAKVERSYLAAAGDSVPLPVDSGEAFYVLQNDYQQLVFSTKGGSLAEINLPLEGTSPKSIVKELDIDRQILKFSPQNAHFPLRAYYKAENGNAVLQQMGVEGGYYPLLRRPIMNGDGTQRTTVDPSYYAMSISGDDKQSYKVTSFGPRMIQFKGNGITKTFTIPEEREGPYCFELEIQVDKDATGLMLSSGVPDVELVGGAYTPQLKYQIKTPGGADVDEIKLPKDAPTIDPLVNPYWVSNCNGFLGVILDPLSSIGNGYKAQRVEGVILPTRLTLIDSAYQLYSASSYPGYTTLLPLKSGTNQFRIFAGPYDEALLKNLDALYEDPLTHYSPEYNLAISIQGWFSFISQPFSKFLFFLMNIFYKATHSWAVSIVLLTLALRAMMYPLNNWSIKSNVKMQAVAPKISALKEKYKKDPKKFQAEQMLLYKQEGVNPFGGCLPMLIQMPFLIGMFYMLKSSFPLRGAPFIPGWIDDLAAPDVLFSWGQPIWLIGNEFHLLPILTGLVMFIQGKMTQKAPKDPKTMTDAEKQMQMMGPMMSILFTVMFYSFPSGLNIYFCFSTLLGIAQQKFIMHQVNKLKK